MLCALILYVSGGTYSLTSTLIFEKLFGRFIYSQSFCRKSAERVNIISQAFNVSGKHIGGYLPTTFGMNCIICTPTDPNGCNGRALRATSELKA